MDLSQAILGRRAVREYTTQAVDEQTIRRVIGAAVQAPSAVNQQPWTFTVVRDRSALDRISHEAKTFMRANLPPGPMGEHLQHRLSDPDFHIFYHAPLLILISAKAEGPWIIEDCALAAENLMLAAHAEGLGSCWIGFAQGYLNTPAGKTALGLPAACAPVAPIIVGHPKAMPPPGAAEGTGDSLGRILALTSLRSHLQDGQPHGALARDCDRSCHHGGACCLRAESAAGRPESRRRSCR